MAYGGAQRRQRSGLWACAVPTLIQYKFISDSSDPEVRSLVAVCIYSMINGVNSISEGNDQTTLPSRPFGSFIHSRPFAQMWLKIIWNNSYINIFNDHKCGWQVKMCKICIILGWIFCSFCTVNLNGHYGFGVNIRGHYCFLITLPIVSWPDSISSCVPRHDVDFGQAISRKLAFFAVCFRQCTPFWLIPSRPFG